MIEKKLPLDENLAKTDDNEMDETRMDEDISIDDEIDDDTSVENETYQISADEDISIDSEIDEIGMDDDDSADNEAGEMGMDDDSLTDDEANEISESDSTLVDAELQDEVITISGTCGTSDQINLFKKLFCDKFFYLFIVSPSIDYVSTPKIIDSGEGFVILDYGSYLALSNFDYFLKGSLSCYKMEKAVKLMLQVLLKNKTTEVSIDGLDIIVRLFNNISNYVLPYLIITNKSEVTS